MPQVMDPWATTFTVLHVCCDEQAIDRIAQSTSAVAVPAMPTTAQQRRGRVGIEWRREALVQVAAQSIPAVRRQWHQS